MLARFIPAINNKIVPKVGFVTILLTNIMLLWQKFLESAGWAVAQLGPDDGHANIAYAGFLSFLKPLVLIAQPILISFLQQAINSKIHENSVKPVLLNKNQ